MIVDLAEESLHEGTYPVNADTIVKLKGSKREVFAVNSKTCVSHVVDLHALAVEGTGRWAAACGWICFGPLMPCFRSGRWWAASARGEVAWTSSGASQRRQTATTRSTR